MSKKDVLLKLAKWIIRKYFNEGLTPVYGCDDFNKIIAWKWMFYDEKYEKERNLTRKLENKQFNKGYNDNG